MSYSTPETEKTRMNEELWDRCGKPNFPLQGFITITYYSSLEVYPKLTQSLAHPSQPPSHTLWRGKLFHTVRLRIFGEQLVTRP